MHEISGIIIPTGMLRLARHLFPGIKDIVLPQDISILPVTSDYIAISGDNSPIVKPFNHLTEHIADVLRDYSADWGIAFIETEYWGGSGCQRAMAWINSGIVFGPEETNNDDSHPINRALAEIGVERTKEIDEFDCLKLGEYRSFDEIYMAELRAAAGTTESAPAER